MKGRKHDGRRYLVSFEVYGMKRVGDCSIIVKQCMKHYKTIFISPVFLCKEKKPCCMDNWLNLVEDI